MPLPTNLPTSTSDRDPGHTAGHNATNTRVNLVAAEVNAHEVDTTDVHGITDTAALETTTGSAAKVAAHAAASDPHGDRAYAAAAIAAHAATSVVNVKDYGALGTNDPVAEQAGMDAALTYAVANGVRTIYFPAGTYRYSGVWQINNRGIKIVGDRQGNPAQTGGSRINFYSAGSGAASGIQLGTDNGAPYGNADYGGVQGLTLQDISLYANGPAGSILNLANGQGTYIENSCAIRDWRGGDVRLIRTVVRNFENGFWGVNSDVNRWQDTEFAFCKNAIYLGPRSDQFVSRDAYCFQNDRDLWIDGCEGATFYNLVSVISGVPTSTGTGSQCPILMTADYTKASGSTTFIAPWLEHLAGTPGIIDAWFDLGPDDTDASVGEVVITNPNFGNNRSTDSPTYHQKYLVKAGKVQTVVIRSPMGGLGASNTDFLVGFVGATSPEVFVEATGALWQYVDRYTNLGSGTPRFHYHRIGGSTGSAFPNQTTAHQAMSNLIIQKADAATGTGATPFEIHRDQSGTRSVIVNTSGNLFCFTGFGVSGRNINGALIQGIGSFTKTWDPGTVTNGTIASTTVTATGAVVGDPTMVGFTPAVPAGVILTASITASGTATATAYNVSGSSWTPGSGTLRVDVMGH